jgi:hypothetical protein
VHVNKQDILRASLVSVQISQDLFHLIVRHQEDTLRAHSPKYTGSLLQQAINTTCPLMPAADPQRVKDDCEA